MPWTSKPHLLWPIARSKTANERKVQKPRSVQRRRPHHPVKEEPRYEDMPSSAELYDWEHRYTRECKRPEPVEYDIDDNWKLITSLVNPDGGFNGGIDLVENRNNKEIAVRKRLRPSRAYAREEYIRWRREMRMMRKLSHPNIPYFIDGFYTPSKGSIYMKACRLGSLNGFVSSRRQKTLTPELQELFLWHVMHDVAEAVLYMQTGFRTLADAKKSSREKVKGWVTLVHADIRTDQIFLDSTENDPTPRALLGDFGFGQFIRPWVRSERHDGPGAPTSSKAPEFPYEISEATDVFGLGVVAQMYLAPNRKVKHGFDRGWLSCFSKASTMLDELVFQCCATRARDRPNIRKVLEMLEWGLADMRQRGLRIEDVRGPLFKSLFTFPSSAGS